MPTRADIERLWSAIRELGPRRLAIAGLVCVVGALSVLAATYLTGRPDLEVAYVGLSPSDAGRISRVLGDAGLLHELSADGARLMTRRSDTSRVRALLAERGLPSAPGSGYELFDKVGPLGLTSFMQEVTRVRALEGEIARTVQMLKGVRTARVHVVMGEAGSFRRQRQAPSASVMIRLENPADRTQADAVRHIVAAAVPGLAASEVRVVSSDGQVLSAAGDSISPGADRLVSLEKSIALDIQGNVSRTLAPHLGLENFEVSVTPRLNIDRRQTSETTYSPETRVERSVRLIKETGSSQNNGARQHVSVEQNVPGEQGASSGGDQTRRASQKRDELTNYEVGSRATAVVSEGYRIERLSVAVVVNAKRFADPGGAAAPEDAVKKRVAEIERLVASAAGLDRSRGDVVTVSVVDFVEAAVSPDAVSAADGAKSWLARHDALLVQLAVAFGVAGLVILFGIRPAIRALSTEPRAALASPDRTEPRLPGAPRDASAMLLEHAQEPPVREAPADLIRRLAQQDPSRVALVLRRWLREETAG